MKYKLIAVDLDGTLYNDQLKITSDTLNTMIKAQEMGIRIALASGRPLPGLFHARDLLKLNEHHGMLVAYNGGKVVDTTTNEVLYDKYIPDDLAMELLEHLKDYPVNPIIDDGKVLYVTDKNGYRVKEEALNDSMEYVEVPSLTEHLDFHLNKILTAVDPQKTYDVLETIGMPLEIRSLLSVLLLIILKQFLWVPAKLLVFPMYAKVLALIHLRSLLLVMQKMIWK